MNDRKALRDLCAGSQEALIWIMNKYGGYVSTIVWNIIGPTMSIYDSEEVVSDVFLALWNSSSAIRTNSIKSYLAGIARNKAKMKLRESGHTLVLDCNIIEFEISNPEDEYEKKELGLLVKKAIDQIKEPDREILLRYFYYYQTMDTISSEMGINLSTVKTKIRRGKDSIRSYLLSRFNNGGLL
ncbi:MAG: RNA polymerase sigma factor [Faecousia sp.]